MEIFTDITIYHWLALGLLLLIAEMLGASGFLLGAAAAAFGMSAILWLVPDMGITWQLVLYAIGAVVLSVIYFQLFRDAQSTPARPMLNNRAKRLLGHRFTLEQDIDLGHGKVQIGDTLWSVETDTPLPKGTLVEVVDTNIMSLRIEPR